jgi:hypothetical protein
LGKKSVHADAEEEHFQDLLSLLLLLSHLVSKDFIDFHDVASSQEQVENATNVVAQVVFTGLSQVIPFMSDQLLSYPSLSKQYFTLVSFVVEIYAEKLVLLDTKLFGMLLHTLLVGMKHFQVEVARYSFQAIAALANYHLKNNNQLVPTRGGAGAGGGLAVHLQPSRHPEMFVHFMKVIFQIALFEDFQPVILDSCATALYPLLLIEQTNYFGIAEEICREQQEEQVRERLMGLFGQLTECLGPSGVATPPGSHGLAISRKNRAQFKANLYKFVADARGFLQMK